MIDRVARTRGSTVGHGARTAGVVTRENSRRTSRLNADLPTAGLTGRRGEASQTRAWYGWGGWLR
jgi:hypothetical protein